MLIVFIVLSAIEIPIVDLIAHPWPWLRIPLLIAGIWGVTWMLGLLLGFITRPHAVGPEGIRVRSGAEIDIDLPWEVVERVVRSKDRRREGAEDRGRASTDARSRCGCRTRPTSSSCSSARSIARLPKGAESVDAVRLWVDDPDGFMSAVRTHIP